MLPRILLIGDSIRMGYAPLVTQHLAQQAEIAQIPQNGGDSQNVRTHLKEWLVQADAPNLSIIHFNCGLHDIKRPFDATENQQPLTEYVSNLRQIVPYLQEHTPSKLVWASSTPVVHERHHAVKGFDRFQEDVEAYNAAAAKIMLEHAVPINDLFRVIQDDSPEECIAGDGVHMTERGNRRLANQVTKVLRDILARED